MRDLPTPSRGPESTSTAPDRETRALGVEADWEAVTKAAFAYRSEYVYPYFQTKNLPLDLCQAAQAERHYVAPEAARRQVAYVTGCGHGGPDAFNGYFNHPVFAVGGYDAEEVRGKIVHLLSCLAAQKLGPDFVSSGCRAFFGYDQDFLVVFGGNDHHFFECDGEIDRAFADGLTAGVVHDRVVALFRRKIAELRAAGRFHVANTLAYDLAHLMCPATGPRWGDVDAKLS